jgi:gluconate 5-dehydrogenase
LEKKVSKTIKELFDLTGKTAIVTGGSRGIGKEMAEGLAEAGASLMLCARRAEWLDETLEEFRAKGFNAIGKLGDVSKPEDVQAVVDETVEKFGKIDILINNAGISWGAMPEEMPLNQWQKVLDVNLTGCFLMAQAVGREMLKRKSGSIINIASISGLTSSADGPFYAGYVASKAGLIGLTRELAASWGRRGIRVNAIAPGFFHSRLADAVIDRYEGDIRDNNPIPRIGAEGELKGAAVFLAAAASSYVTGQTIVVDGGMTI